MLAKKRDALDDGLIALLAASPFVLLATADADGRCDVSPRGGPPGFVKPLDDRHVAVPDLNGNNLLDSFRNVVVNPHAGLLVLVPGQDETLRIDGRARLTDDDDVLDLFVEEVRRPVLALVVETEAVYTHCAKSFRRGRLWDPASWPVLDRSLALAARVPPARARRALRGVRRRQRGEDRRRPRRRRPRRAGVLDGNLSPPPVLWLRRRARAPGPGGRRWPDG